MDIPTTTYDHSAHKLYRFAHVKRDGHCVEVIHTNKGYVSCWSNGGKDITHKLQYHPLYKVWQRMPVGTRLFCEMWSPGVAATSIPTIINDESHELRIDTFAACQLRGIDFDRLPVMALDTVATLINGYGLQFIPFTLIESWDQQTEFYQSVAARNLLPAIEGYVFKNGNLTDWSKCKPQRTVDLIITGFVPGKGQHLGKIGSVIVATAEGYEVASVGVMTHQIRDYITAHIEELIGKIVEVEFTEVASQGRLKHPRFVRFRDDKTRDRCSVDQDTDLKRAWSGRLFV